MRIKKNTVKSIKEIANVVNGFCKTYRNPKNSFLYLISGEYLNGDYEKCGDKEYIYSIGHMSYIVTVSE